MVAPDATKKFTVSDHALKAYRRRFPAKADRATLEREIEEHVTKGIEAGYVLRYKPEGFLLYGQKPEQLEDGTRFVYRQPNASVGFIVKRFPQEDVVITTLTRSGARR